MTAYVLVIMLLTGNAQGGAFATHVPFRDSALCHQAAQKINEDAEKGRFIAQRAYCFKRF